MPGRKDQKSRELKRAAESCSKLTDIFKKAKKKSAEVVIEVSNNEDNSPSTTSAASTSSAGNIESAG